MSCSSCIIVNKIRGFRGRSLFISWGGGLGNFSGGHEKILPHLWIHMGRSQMWFPFPFLASKCSGLWGAKTPQTPSLVIIFSFFMPHFSLPPPKNENMKWYAYAEMPLVRFFCGSAHRNFIIRKYRHFVWCILFPTSVIRKVNLQHPTPLKMSLFHVRKEKAKDI